MFKSKKSIIIFIVVIVLLILALGYFLYSELNISKKPWSVVYLATGEIYVGKVSCFPKLRITDAYILQMVNKPVEPTAGEEVTGETKTSFQLTPIKDALWAPKKLYLNPKQVVFYGPVEENSKVAEAIRNAAK
jgi:flagellar basal body-associated protein FliL